MVRVRQEEKGSEDKRMRSQFIGTYRKPSGHVGNSTAVRLCLVGSRLIEVYPFGFIRSPYLSMDILDAAEATWLIDNHQFSKYRPDKEN